MKNNNKSDSLRSRFARNMHKARSVKCLSQESFADACGLHRAYMGTVERGQVNSGIDNIEKIARTLGMESGERLAAENSALSK